MAEPRVLDTTVASLLMQRSPLLAPYRPWLEDAELSLSFQSIAEMRFGALRAGWGARRTQAPEIFLDSFFVVTYSDGLSHCWAEVMHEARRVGRRLEAGDAWIAATARYLDAPLLTQDRDFAAEACPSITVIRFL